MDCTRRVLLTAAAAAAALPAVPKRPPTRRFRTEHLDVEMSIEFHDGYRSESFRFRDQYSDRGFCLSATGETEKNCLANFRGSLAIVHYRIRPRSRKAAVPALREHVRTVDRDPRLDSRAPFEREIKLDNGRASDLQAFGYEATPHDPPIPAWHSPWYLHRQDLFLAPEPRPFLIVYWKHSLSSIRALDIIPGEHTWVVTE